jgi:HSP20 family molecular chaperone IbpA
VAGHADGDRRATRTALALLGAVLAGSAIASAADPPLTAARDQPRALPVSVHETSDVVQLRVQLPSGGDPGSVEVQLDDLTVTVLARGPGGIALRSDRLTLRAPAVESDATADYEGDGWLTVTLRRRPPAP